MPPVTTWKLLVSQYSASSSRLFDVPANTPDSVDPLSATGGQLGIAWHPYTPGKYAYCDHTNSQLVIATVASGVLYTCAGIGNNSSGDNPIAWLPNGNQVLVSGDNVYLVAATSNNSIIHTWTALSGGAITYDVAVTPDGLTGFVTVPGATDGQAVFAVSLISPYAYNAGVHGGQRGIAVSPDGKWIFSSSDSGSLYATPTANLLTDTMVSISTSTLRGIVVAPDNSWVAVVDQTNGLLHKYPWDSEAGSFGSPTTCSLSSTRSNFATISPDGSMVYVVGFGGNVDSVATNTMSASTIAVGNSPESGTVTPDQAPTAAFTSTQSGLSVTFSDSSTTPVGTITSWVWDFGDSNTSTVQNPVHVYDSGGQYTVTLSVTNSAGTSTSTVWGSKTAMLAGGPSAQLSQSIVVGSGSWSKASQSNWSGQGPVV